jgi:Ca-activated chloride channel family protein
VLTDGWLKIAATHEDDAAFARFDNADTAMQASAMQSSIKIKDEELDYRLHYNRGILQFHAGKFDEAANEFKNALKIDASRIEAKRNLELSLLSMEQQNSAASSSPVEITNDQGADNTLFDYIRQKEVDSWIKSESEEDQNMPWLDY